MSNDAFDNIIERINNNRDINLIDSAIIEINNITPKTITEYIILQFNKCLLYQWSGNDSSFIESLSELNNIVTSGLITDLNTGEDILCNIAKLNYQIHNYKIAKKLLEKSLEQEFPKEMTKFNIESRFRKRLLLAFCNEYITLSIKDVNLFRDSFSRLVNSLVGINLLDFNSKDSDRTFVVDKLVEISENPDLSIIDIVQLLINWDIIKQNDDLLTIVMRAYDNKIITKSKYKDWVSQIIHIFSHCLSEYYNKAVSYNESGYSKKIYYKRLSEILMKKLGDDYVTCYATLKMENYEYYSAINTLISTRERLVKKATEDNDKNIYSLIAEIDFYYWYFSVYTHHIDFEKSYKESFFNYCKENKEDEVANTYYHILNMKELLIKGFDELKRNNANNKTKTDIEKFYYDFNNCKPRYMIHKEIAEEWDILNNSYNIYNLCFEICEKSKKNEDIQILILKLSQLLLNSVTNNSETIKYRSPKSANKYTEIFNYVTSINSEYIYKGSRRKLTSLCYYLNIPIIRISPFKITEANGVIKRNRQNTSNVLVLASDLYFDEDIAFIKEIISLDQGKPTEDEHSVFINVSSLCEKNLRIIEKLYNDCQVYHKSLFIIHNEKTAVTLCNLFASLETYLRQLYKRMDSHIISPVKVDSSFAYQYCNELSLISFSENQELILVDFTNWYYSFCSCFINDSNNPYVGKRLDLLLLKNKLDDIDCISYIFQFKMEESNNNSIDLCAFQISKTYTDESGYSFGDNITIKDSQSRLYSSAPDFMYALKQLSDKLQFQLNHREICNNELCYSKFTYADINNNEHYRNLRAYLYSYLGIMLQKSIFLLIQDEGGFNRSLTGKSYILCAFNSPNLEPAYEHKVCETLRNCNYIEMNYIGQVPRKNADILLNKTRDDVQELERKIVPHKKENKYIFISYRSKKGMPKLCIPVYQDVIYLQNHYKKLDCVIDIKSFDTRVRDDIINYINNDNCIGSFVYLSEEYLNAGSIGYDICLEEMKLLIEKKKHNSKFFIIPIFLKESIENSSSIGSLEDLVRYFKRFVLDNIENSNDMERIDSLNYILNITGESTINSFYMNWEYGNKHLSNHSKNMNFINMLRNNEMLEKE